MVCACETPLRKGAELSVIGLIRHAKARRLSFWVSFHVETASAPFFGDVWGSRPPKRRWSWVSLLAVAVAGHPR